MAVTPSGWPYAVPNDTLVSWPAQSQALANKLESAIGASDTLDLMRVAGTPISQQEINTGSAWQTPYGLTLLAKADFTTAASVTIDNVFTSAYANYQVVVALTAANANDQQLRVVFRAATVEPANNYYSALTYRSWLTGTTSVVTNTNAAYGWIGGDSATHASSTFVVCNPNTTNRTTWQGVGVGANGTSGGGGVQADNTAFDGIKITSAASQISGTVRVYGFRKQ
jgi:hypothetical protein